MRSRATRSICSTSMTRKRHGSATSWSPTSSTAPIVAPSSRLAGASCGEPRCWPCRSSSARPTTALGTAEHAIAHAPGVFERTLDTVRSGLGRGTIRAAETLPSNGASTGEMVGSAGAGGGAAALGGGLAAKVLIAGTTAVCAFGGQQLCVQLLGSQPSPKPPHAHTVALRPQFPVTASGGQGRPGSAACWRHRGPAARPPRARRRRAPRATTRRHPHDRDSVVPPVVGAPSQRRVVVGAVGERRLGQLVARPDL